MAAAAKSVSRITPCGCGTNDEGEAVPPTDVFVDAQTLAPEDHLAMQAAAQDYVDSSISKTINLPRDISFEAFKGVYESAYSRAARAARPTPERRHRRGARGSNPKHRHSCRPCRAGRAWFISPSPLDRPEDLPGKTYKIKWPGSDHASTSPSTT